MQPTTILLHLLALSTVSLAARKPANSVLLSSVNTLTLRDGQKTSARRVSPIPQLKCVGGNAKNIYSVDVMRCKNAGSDYDDADVQWTCQASLPPEFKLGSTEVVCEGFDSPDDPYILKGSCGVEYRLVLTEQGERKYGKEGSGYSDVKSNFKPGTTTRDRISSLVFWGIFLTILGMIIYAFLYPNTAGLTQPRRRPYREFGGGGWGGDDGSDDPPPPYTSRPSRGYSKPSSGSNSRRQGGGWNPGFWTGAATGAAAGYTMGNRGSSNRTRAPEPQAGSSSWFGGGGSGGSGGASGASSPPSSSRHESTGFGSTTRR